MATVHQKGIIPYIHLGRGSPECWTWVLFWLSQIYQAQLSQRLLSLHLGVPRAILGDPAWAEGTGMGPGRIFLGKRMLRNAQGSGQG